MTDMSSPSRLGFFIGVMLSFAFGLGLGWLLFHGGTSAVTPAASSSGSHAIYAAKQDNSLIDPLYLCLNPQNGSADVVALHTQLDNLVKDRIKQNAASRVSIYFRDLNSGNWTSINDTERYFPASMLKITVMINYYLAAMSKPETLAKNFMVDGQTNANAIERVGSALPLPAGTYSAESLIEHMIENSDNTAEQLLSAGTDDAARKRVFQDLQLEVPDLNDLSYTMTAREYSRFFRVLYNATYLNQDFSEKALSLLAKATYHDGLVAGVPDGVTVAHKFGEREIGGTGNQPEIDQLHDCGIVYVPGHPYVLCVMTEGQGIQNLQSVIQAVSQLVYNDVTTKDSE